MHNVNKIEPIIVIVFFYLNNMYYINIMKLFIILNDKISKPQCKRLFS